MSAAKWFHDIRVAVPCVGRRGPQEGSVSISTSAPIGTKPHRRNARSDAALPGATCAHTRSFAGTSRSASSMSAPPAPGGATAAAIGGEQLDRHLTTADQPRADRDQTVLVGENPHVATVMAGPSHPRVIVEVRPLTHGSTATATTSARDQHRVVRADDAARAGQPPEQVGVRRSSEAIGSAGHHGGRFARREHERVAGELDARHRAVFIGLADVDATVDQRKRPVRGGDQRCVERMHVLEITVGQCASMS